MGLVELTAGQRSFRFHIKSFKFCHKISSQFNAWSPGFSIPSSMSWWMSGGDSDQNSKTLLLTEFTPAASASLLGQYVSCWVYSNSDASFNVERESGFSVAFIGDQAGFFLSLRFFHTFSYSASCKLSWFLLLLEPRLCRKSFCGKRAQLVAQLVCQLICLASLS